MLMYELSQINNDIPKAEGISPRLASLLYARGARDREAMELFLHPGEGQFLDPLLMKDMDKAPERIKRAVAGEKICVYGDYDADGVCGMQFHPESIMTPDGAKILANFLEL